MSDFMRAFKVNYLIGKRSTLAVIIISLIFGISTITDSLWIFPLILLAAVILFAYRRIVDDSVFGMDAFTYMSFSISIKSNVRSKILISGLLTVLGFGISAAMIKIMSVVLNGGLPYKAEMMLKNIFFNTDGSASSLIIIGQVIAIVCFSFAFPALDMLLITVDKTRMSNGRYGYMMFFAIIIAAGLMLIQAKISLSPFVIMIEIIIAVIVMVISLLMTERTLEKEFFVRNPLLY